MPVEGELASAVAVAGLEDLLIFLDALAAVRAGVALGKRGQL
jgi:hypothetical protein